jgi:hypothetical protein
MRDPTHKKHLEEMVQTWTMLAEARARIILKQAERPAAPDHGLE